MTATFEQAPIDTSEIEDVDLRPVAWFAGNAAVAGLATAAVLLTGIAYSVDPNGFTAQLAAVLSLVAIAFGWAASQHRRAVLNAIDGGAQ